ncbi:MAG: DUF2752 domain-containing protein [Planctomycetaceae bacterium]|nr:DUF2752 domain-containing protein [Planctomycetaceae bacterium]MBT4011330.1 DUF2752 domain-containing protein [Planctomycetaceae bacterium]MBT4725763.1 DUF2752 domain-containing protein [Planctomycetaceae bacterium]MBT4846146.1 DUF2752 domain-containing protein [Planctomycetaceae bacterium]MBT5124299.1 DUF2752 domain-containing protein [Planctomycetaceae bacterium]
MIKRSTFDVLFVRIVQVIVLLLLVLGFVLPSDGMGVPLCLFKSTFSLPCPGCGLTRSVSSVLHGDFLKSWSYHPLGIFFIGAALLFVFNLVMPRRRVVAVRRFFRKHHDSLEILLIAFTAFFIGFGWIRLMAYVVSGVSY